MFLKSVEIKDESDILTSRRMVRDASSGMGFGIVDQTKLATAASELSRNIYRYAGCGTVIIESVESPNGIKVIFEDFGPGIEDTDIAMQEGYTTTPGSLGLGLSGSKRLVDEMNIHSEPEKGTRIEIIKYLP
ncbi:ATP-binding protein [Methanoplanus endosymbiosus]|uniref:ATP-binding protein n=1 Tax=Methanoplanus endosymbiosus TaxID=33865 RepID=A0A9E7TJ80_9EURY|nr:ATP-binding protein [Methanoplanus endosymbiosus]UUX93343.1 ATP-binding protein [Methanoplanus endosymbiosus]